MDSKKLIWIYYYKASHVVLLNFHCAVANSFIFDWSSLWRSGMVPSYFQFRLPKYRTIRSAIKKKPKAGSVHLWLIADSHHRFHLLILFRHWVNTPPRLSNGSQTQNPWCSRLQFRWIAGLPFLERNGDLATVAGGPRDNHCFMSPKKYTSTFDIRWCAIDWSTLEFIVGIIVSAFYWPVKKKSGNRFMQLWII